MPAYNLFPQPSANPEGGVPSAASFLSPFPGMQHVRSAPSLEQQELPGANRQQFLGGGGEPPAAAAGDTSRGLTAHLSMQLPHSGLGGQQRPQPTPDSDVFTAGEPSALTWLPLSQLMMAFHCVCNTTSGHGPEIQMPPQGKP